VSHGHGGHDHGVSANADRRYLLGALGLIVGFMAAEVVLGFVASSLALLSDAAHMLTDAASIVLALVAMRIAARPPRGGYTYGMRRAEIMSAQLNGITLVVLTAVFVAEAVVRLISPPRVDGALVLITAVAGIAVNGGATWLLSRADRSSMNVRGAFAHIVSDLYGFIATAAAGLIVVTTGFARADAIASLVIAALMLRAGWGLVRDAGRVFMEAAPAELSPADIGSHMAEIPTVVEVHDLHVWEVTSGYAALSAHILVEPGADCHAVRVKIEDVLAGQYHIQHTTLQVDHAQPDVLPMPTRTHCADPHGPDYRHDPH
jgi:cobalt-zinc-cadmium efflux system protein